MSAWTASVLAPSVTAANLFLVTNPLGHLGAPLSLATTLDIIGIE